MQVIDLDKESKNEFKIEQELKFSNKLSHQTSEQPPEIMQVVKKV